ncbi:sodium/calcium exchanger 1-like isoform X2 [Folsomia candida]|uniref:sodium/calcium exchanger 1-like isoform X2 n=1 Tax=Folsomia candida TaxID=158441 RepID=UPI0016055796|nr:sodium/calcium exchanger 1-like isoform X2 [Folsomia candida]
MEQYLNETDFNYDYDDDNVDRCEPGIFLPADSSTYNSVVRGLGYLFAMIYVLVGINMGNSLLIGSINVITAQLPNSGFKAVWKRSGLNFALLAVGGSVVEIMIPFFEIFSKNYGAGDLGPGVILGTAAYRHLILTSVLVSAIPNGKIRKIKNTSVFLVQCTWSIFAYLWLILVLKYTTPGVIDLWEGVMTFVFFPVIVITSGLAGHCGMRKPDETFSNPENTTNLETSKCFEIDDRQAVSGRNFQDTQVQHIPCRMTSSQYLSSWKLQFINACKVKGVDDNSSGTSCLEYLNHGFVFIWKIMLAFFVPPQDIMGGYPTFTTSIFIIGLLTALILDLASHLGCSVGLRHFTIGMIIIMGRRIPGSAWMTGALYHEFFSYASCESCSKFYIDPGSLTFETVILACVSLMAIVLLFVRRCTLGGELGGQTFSKYTTSVVLVFMWLVYFFLVSLEAYGLVPGF